MLVPNPHIRPYGTATIAAAAAEIAAGGIVAIPTETVYGLAADASDAAAVARIYAAKGRPSFNPLIVHVADLAAAEAIALFDDDARALAAAFWPGPLTLVLPLRDGAGIAAPVTAGLPTIAIRVPAHRAMQALIAATGRPLAAPSANASGSISPTTAAHVAASLGAKVSIIVDDGPTSRGLESTIVANGTILRPGPVTEEMLRDTLACEYSAEPDAGITAPGQLPGHYAPNKPVRLNAREADADEWLIGFGEVDGHRNLSVTADLAEAATNLFAALHESDAAPSPKIAVAPIPTTGIGQAINDRLTRAAHR
jgi:L-threonylcarbamoyladenylate synthase